MRRLRQARIGGALRRARTGALALLAAALLAPAGADAVEVGIADSNARTLVERHWPGLGVNRLRIVVPYDVATTTGRAGLRRRADFELLRERAAAAGVELLVVFGPSQDVRAPGTGDAVAPTLQEYADGVAAFRAAYPDMTLLGAWNEPNNIDARNYPLGWNPWLAADYWLAAQGICGTACTVVAGEFAGIPNDDWYVDNYLARLGDARPAVFAFHTHGDINAFQADGPDDARIARYYLAKLQGPWAQARIWIDEVGARFRDPSGTIWGDESQARATRFLLGIASLDPRIERIYYYNYSNECQLPHRCAVQDRGLVSPAPWNGQPPGYDAFDRVRAAYHVIANRGPAIPPALPVPPAVTIDQPAQAAAVGTRTPTFTGQAAVGGRAADVVTVQIYTGTGATQSGLPLQTLTAPVVDGRWSVTPTTPLPDGVFTVQASQAGNRTSAGISDPVVFTVDTIPPTTTLRGGPRGAVTGAKAATFRFQASEPNVTFTCSIDGGRFAPCTSPVTVRRMRLGRHAFAVRAVDAAGNVEARPARKRWRRDSLATALAPRTADLGATLANGLPVAITCADGCRVGARLYATAAAARAVGLRARRVSRTDPARPRGRGYVTVASGRLVRARGGSRQLTLRLDAPAGAQVRAASSLTVRLGLVVRGKRTRPVAVSRRVTLQRGGGLRRLAAGGLPVTVACTSACDVAPRLWVADGVARRLGDRGRRVAGRRGNGLPRGRYALLGRTAARRARNGVADLVVPVRSRPARQRLPRLGAAGIRITARAAGPGTPARQLSWPLHLAR